MVSRATSTARPAIGDESPFPEEPHRPHIIDDGVGEAEASDHIDLDGEMTTQLVWMTTVRPTVTPKRFPSAKRLVRDGSDGLS